MKKLKKNKCIRDLSASLEDYLETIATLKKIKKYARIVDIAKYLNVKNSSVNVAVNFLTKNGLTIHEKYGYVDLTYEGLKIASRVQKKHDVLSNFLNKLLFVKNEIAIKEACEIEHVISSMTIHRFERLYKFLKMCFLKDDKNITSLKKYLKIGKM
ncbi:MAG: metal-dependent transcriptional regulator [Endomicrobium sp.]|jgi:DtxR family Mn-dependent transcriptional regulator|nr:metal-dependent transcriptional regulator [Endomicrobium sp.]